MACGQRVWITARSLGATPLNILEGYEVTNADLTQGFINKPVLRAWLEGLATNSAVLIEVAVSLDGSAIAEHAAAFKSTTYTVLGQLKIEQAPMILNGLSIKRPSWPRTGYDSFGNTATRVATGGSGGFTYTSRRPSVASVTPHGVVTGNGWGSTFIDVKDKAGVLVSYAVHVSNVFSLVPAESYTTFPVIQPWMLTGARLVGFDGIADLQRVYGMRLPVIRHYWLGHYDYGRASF